MQAVWLIPLAFACGSLPLSLWLGLLRGVDIRTVGSGNIGATNLGRALGMRWFIAGFLLDAGKGALPTLLAGVILGALAQPAPPPATSWLWLAVAAASILGHTFSPFVRFRGGKGVATGFGSLLAVYPALTWPALIAFAAFSLVLATTRFMGLASVIAAVAMPAAVAALALARDGSIPTTAVPYLVVTAIIAALIVVKHRGNLARTLAGTEPKFGSPPASGLDSATPAPDNEAPNR
ncbi:MAG: glycerol-3-phosphate acyltransferase [Planctomycetota bacterium]